MSIICLKAGTRFKLRYVTDDDIKYSYKQGDVVELMNDFEESDPYVFINCKDGTGSYMLDVDQIGEVL